MAIACRICGKSLQALASGRCRKCRRLICKDCVGVGAFQTAEGFLCRECLKQETLETEEASAPHQLQNGSAHIRWFWVAVVLILAAVLAGLVAYPYLRAARWQRALQADDAGRREAAGRILAEIADRPSLQALRETAESGSTLARFAAIEGLGWCRHPAAADILRRIAADAISPEAIRLAAQESLCRHEQMRRAAGAPGKR